MNERTLFLQRLGFMVCTLGLAMFLSGCTTAPKLGQPGQINHVGLVWLNEPGNAQHRQKIIDAAHSFARGIPEVQFLSVGQTLPRPSPYVDDSFDICVVIHFTDRAAMDRYNKHPVHEKAAREAFLPLSRKILFYDFVSE